MIVTEAEARTKWCPFARVSDTEERPASVNRQWRDARPERGTNCLASDCMAWTRTDLRTGYCGLVR